MYVPHVTTAATTPSKNILDSLLLPYHTLTAAACHYAGMASQAAGRLPSMVPDPNSHHPVTEAHSSYWQAYSFQPPLQVWHQLTAAAVSRLPKSLQEAVPDKGPVTGPEDSGTSVWHATKQVLSWPGLQELGGRVSGRLPGLVPMGSKSSSDVGEGSQVGASCSCSAVVFACVHDLMAGCHVAADNMAVHARGCRQAGSRQGCACTESSTC